MILEFGVYLIAAHYRAERGSADAHVILPHWAALVHGVEGGDTTDIGGSKVQDLRTGLNAGRGYPAFDALHEMQHRQQCGTSLRIPRRDRTHFLQRRLGDLGFRDAVVEAGLVEVRDEVPVPD